MPNVVKCCKYLTIQSVSQILTILIKTKSGRVFHKSLKLLHTKEKNVSHPSLLLSIITFKREQSETRMQEGAAEVFFVINRYC